MENRQLAIIGGSGLTNLTSARMKKNHTIKTPYGETSAPIVELDWQEQTLFFLNRHGTPHHIAPHQVNYRANIWALHSLGGKNIIAVNAVGGIHPAMSPSEIIIPHQLIDYTVAREHSFCGDNMPLKHIDFTHPYSESLRQELLLAAKIAEMGVIDWSVYATTQGPRLETLAEIERLDKEGCHIVGMTSMPEAALARELEMDYACCALVINWAAGKEDSKQQIDSEKMEKTLAIGMKKIAYLLSTVLKERRKKVEKIPKMEDEIIIDSDHD
jgi:5'-methylthioinosine phosphorylase